MYLLTIETTGKLSSASLMDGSGALCGYKLADEPMSHLKGLIPMIEGLLSDCGVEKSKLTHIAASIGPGSFTGIRIGVSTARALCQALNLPAVAVPTMESFLYKKEALDADEDTVVCAVINARRSQVYGVIDGFMEARACLIGDVLKIIKEEIFPKGKKVLFLGDGIDAYGDLIEDDLSELGLYEFAEENIRYQEALSAGLLAFEKVKKGQVVKYEELLPDYMRKAEAEQKLEAGELPICKGPRQE